MAAERRAAAAKHHPSPEPSNPVDEEFAGEHGTTLFPSSVSDERHPEEDPQNPAGAVRKLKKEAAEGDGVVDKASRAVHEIDRQLGGEYERREDTTSAPVPVPGTEAAPDAPSDPRDAVELDEEQGVVTRREESGVGPGAGESAVVRVTAPVQRKGDGARTQHPSLRDKPAQP